MRRGMEDVHTHLRTMFLEGDSTVRQEPTKRTILSITTRKSPTLEQIKKRKRIEERRKYRRLEDCWEMQ